MLSCARPACAEVAAGFMLLHRADRVVELLAVDDPLGLRYGVSLCSGHLARARAPKGWELVDRVAPAQAEMVPSSPARPRVHGALGSATNPGPPVWLPRRGFSADEDSALRTASSPLLRRAFQGEMADAGQIEGQQRLRV